jgi:hypothetical protein
MACNTVKRIRLGVSLGFQIQLVRTEERSKKKKRGRAIFGGNLRHGWGPRMGFGIMIFVGFVSGSSVLLDL